MFFMDFFSIINSVLFNRKSPMFNVLLKLNKLVLIHPSDIWFFPWPRFDRMSVCMGTNSNCNYNNNEDMRFIWTEAEQKKCEFETEEIIHVCNPHATISVWIDMRLKWYFFWHLWSFAIVVVVIPLLKQIRSTWIRIKIDRNTVK